MVPSQAVIQVAIREAIAKHPDNKYLSVAEVHQFIPRNEGYVIPARSTLVADAICATYPQAEDIGGGVFQIKR